MIQLPWSLSDLNTTVVSSNNRGTVYKNKNDSKYVIKVGPREGIEREARAYKIANPENKHAGLVACYGTFELQGQKEHCAMVLSKIRGMTFKKRVSKHLLHDKLGFYLLRCFINVSDECHAKGITCLKFDINNIWFVDSALKIDDIKFLLFDQVMFATEVSSEEFLKQVKNDHNNLANLCEIVSSNTLLFKEGYEKFCEVVSIIRAGDPSCKISQLLRDVL